jgi:DNA helicase-2/ATP-dependent DNA helicase PcrA
MKEKYIHYFKEEYAKLNAPQQKAVDTTDGAVLVVAGPGTGKTQILAARIANILLKTDAKPQNILCLTFTDAGVVAMRNRLERFIGTDAYKVNIHTFHSFCNKVIQENASYFSVKELEPIGDLERIQLMEKLVDGFDVNHPLKRMRGDVYYEISSGRLNNLFSMMKRENKSAEDIEKAVDAYIEDLPNREGFYYKRKYKEFNAGDPNPKKIEAEKAKMDLTIAAAKEMKNYDQLKAEKGYYDFDDMILWVLKAFKEDEDLLLNYQERFQYILVDEYQDTNGAQNDIFKQLISYWENPNAFVVGDDDQSIYRFQGANLTNIVDFYEKVICNAFKTPEEVKKRVIVMDNN